MTTGSSPKLASHRLKIGHACAPHTCAAEAFQLFGSLGARLRCDSSHRLHGNVVKFWSSRPCSSDGTLETTRPGTCFCGRYMPSTKMGFSALHDDSKQSAPTNVEHWKAVQCCRGSSAGLVR